jgi:PAS domain S-box-containing protein
MRGPLRVLVVDDSEEEVALLVRELGRGYEVEHERVETPETMAAALDRQVWDLVVCDYAMRRFDTRAALAMVRHRGLDLPFIVVSDTINDEAAIDAMRAGAHDFLRMDNLARLLPAVERKLREVAVRAERTRAQEALAESELRYQALLDALGDAVYVIDRGDSVRYVNVAGLRLLGRPVEEVISRPRASLFPPEVAADQRESLDRVYATGEPLLVERSTEIGGRMFHQETQLVPLRGVQGAITSVLGISRDVSERRRMQEQLLVSDRMVSMGRLAAGVAHEINNPLAAVMANLDLAARDLARRAERLGIGAELHEVREELGDAREAAARIRDIVRDLRIFSRSEEDSRSVIHVRRVMESTLRMAWNEIRHRARLVKSYGEAPPVEASESRLGQVFLNLVVNAAQAIAEGHADANEIRIATATDAAGRATVEIADTGRGMTPEVRARLFTPFFTTKPVGVGTGLGLSICQRIVTDLGGTIEVESESGKGTVVRVSLPPASADRAERPPPVAAPETTSGRRGRVLVVDDDAAIGRVVERALSAQHDVVVVASGSEALQRISSGTRFDVILCNLMMPLMTGMELHAELLRVACDQACRMIFLTGGAFTPRAREFLDQTPNLRLEKPFDPMQLRALVNERLAGVGREE